MISIIASLLFFLHGQNVLEACVMLTILKLLIFLLVLIVAKIPLGLLLFFV